MEIKHRSCVAHPQSPNSLGHGNVNLEGFEAHCLAAFLKASSRDASGSDRRGRQFEVGGIINGEAIFSASSLVLPKTLRVPFFVHR